MNATRPIKFAAVALAIAMAACDSASGSSVSFSVQPTSLSFEGVIGAGNPPGQVITLTLSAPLQGGALYLKGTLSGDRLFILSQALITSNTSGEAQVIASPASVTEAGTYTGTLSIVACTTDP